MATCCYLMQVLQVTSSFACELRESSSLFVRRIYGDVKANSGGLLYAFPVHSGRAGKGDHKHHRKVSRKQRGVITLDSGCRGRRGKALKGFLYQTVSVLTPDGLSRPRSLVI